MELKEMVSAFNNWSFPFPQIINYSCYSAGGCLGFCLGFVLGAWGLCNALLCQEPLVVELVPWVVLLDVLEKPTFSKAGKSWFGKARVFWEVWDRNRGIDSINLKLMVKLCSSCAVSDVVVTWKDEMYGIEAHENVCKKQCFREMREEGQKALGYQCLYLL